MNKLKSWREKNNYTQSEIAAICGVTQACISKLESSGKPPESTTAIAIARRLGVGVGDLFEFESVIKKGS